MTISGLSSLTTYFFQITSANVFGSGPTSTATVTSTTFGVPSAPSQPTVTQTSGSTSVIVTWSAPSNNGGTLISYSLQVLKLDGTTYQTIDADCTEYDSGSTSILAASTTCTILMTELMTQGGFTVAGTYIKVRVLASNTYGSGSYSTTNVNSVVYQTAPTLDVTTVILSKTKNTVTATWTTSPTTLVGTGYASITHYLYRIKESSGTYGSWSTPLLATAPLTQTFSGLTPDTIYNV
jgi:hypothetical protein